MPTPLQEGGAKIYYELYIDVFILVNFMMDLCVLSISKKILKCPAKGRNLCWGALVGSGITSVVIMIPIPYNFIKFVVFHGLISVLMIKTGLRIKWNRSFFKAYIVVYVSTFLVGGILLSLKQYVCEISIFFLFAFFSYLAAVRIWNYICYLAGNQINSSEVLLCNGTNQVKVQAIWDTGNRLRDVITGKPVSIISKETAQRLWQDTPIQNLRYIPYHTIGKKEGILPVFQVERVCFYLEEAKWVHNILVAVSEELSGTAEYEMILNPDMR